MKSKQKKAKYSTDILLLKATAAAEHDQSLRPTVQSRPLVKQTVSSKTGQLRGWENWVGVRGPKKSSLYRHTKRPCPYWSRQALFTDPSNPGTKINAD